MSHVKVITGRRQSGKTTKLINISRDTGYPIVTLNKGRAANVRSIARRMGVYIPTPMSLGEYRRNHRYPSEPVLVDDVESILSFELDLGNIYAMVVNGDELEVARGRFVLPAKVVLAIANYAVAALNGVAFIATRSPRDMLSAVAWIGSGTFWLWQALEERHV